MGGDGGRPQKRKKTAESFLFCRVTKSKIVRVNEGTDAETGAGGEIVSDVPFLCTVLTQI